MSSPQSSALPDGFSYAPTPIQPCKPVTLTWRTAAVDRTIQIYTSKALTDGPMLEIDISNSTNITLVAISDFISGEVNEILSQTTIDVYQIDFVMSALGDKSCYVKQTVVTNHSDISLSLSSSWTWMSPGAVNQCNDVQIEWIYNLIPASKPVNGSVKFDLDATSAFPFKTTLSLLIRNFTADVGTKLKLPFLGGRHFTWNLYDSDSSLLCASDSNEVTPSNDASCAFDSFYAAPISSPLPPPSNSPSLAITTQGTPGPQANSILIPHAVDYKIVGGSSGGIFILLVLSFITWRLVRRQRRGVRIGLESMDGTESHDEDARQVSPFQILNPTPLILGEASKKDSDADHNIAARVSIDGNSDAPGPSEPLDRLEQHENRGSEGPLYHRDGGRVEFPPSYSQVQGERGG